MRVRALSCLVLAAIWCRAGGAQTAAPRELVEARAALGMNDLRSVVIEFDYRAAVSAAVTGRGESPYGGRGRLVYDRPAKLRFERTNDSMPVGPVTTAWIDTPAGFTMWSGVQGQPARILAAGPDPEGRRRRREADAVVLLSALLLADADLLTYHHTSGGRFVARSTGGNEVELVLSAGRVQEVRYQHGVFAAVSPGKPNSVAPPATTTQMATVRVSDFLATGTGTLPHRLRIEYLQGWEELTIKRYVVNASIAPKEFQAPAVSPRR